jgi:hypothetical protein
MVFVFDKPRVLAGHLALVMYFLHAGQERETLLCAEEPMTTVELITAVLETGKKWGSSGSLGLFLLPGACVKPGIPTAEGAA